MKDWRRVSGSQETKPEEFDLVSSPFVVYQRKNIERVTETQEMDGQTVEIEMWQYDEREMSREEYMEVFAKPMIEAIANIEDVLCELDAQ